MKTNKKVELPKPTLLKKIKVRLDYKTVVVINRLASFEIWKQQYPEATIIS